MKRGTLVYGQTDGDHKTEVIIVDYSCTVSERSWPRVKPKDDDMTSLSVQKKKNFVPSR